jgi:hypothetical protein
VGWPRLGSLRFERGGPIGGAGSPAPPLSRDKPLHLSPSIHLAKIGQDVVILDARADAYYCLPAAASDIEVGPAGIRFGDPGLEHQFVEAGFLAKTPPRRRALSPRPQRDLGAVSASQPRLADIGLIVLAWLTMLVSYLRADFARLTRCVDDRGAPTTEPSGEVLRLVAAFERVLPWLPFQGLCLYRAFLLRRVLRWRGHRVRWVFGVRTWPFLAHCWLQAGDVVLDDAAERLVAFTPIMEL